ncbi:MAG TPA: hypothetical protein PKI03_22440 [Pseudomonadota bacterium]|nr:hypothetical protein [Pseudomonadota bacterium]
MAPSFDPNGLLDVAKLSERDYAPLPKPLAAFKPEKSAGEPGPLFPHAPVFSDLDVLLRVRKIDDSLHACFSSLLGGLSSGPAVVMSAFRALPDQSVVVRMHAPARPKPHASLPPIYIRVPRSHAQLAVDRGWVPANAAPWLTLYAAVYYTLIGDPVAFYERKDLGGADNAAWLVFYGKDSARAESEESESGGAAGGGIKRQSPAVLKDLYAQIFGAGKKGVEGIDAHFLVSHAFGGNQIMMRTRGPQYLKQWLAAVRKQAPMKSASLAKPLASATPLPEAALQTWLQSHKNLSPELCEALFLFLELNGVLALGKAERYSAGARSLWQGIHKLLGDGVPVALEIDARDALRKRVDATELSGGTVATSVLTAPMVELGKRNEPRALRYLGLLASAGSAEKVEVVAGKKWQQLLRVAAPKGVCLLDAEQALLRGVRLHVGAKALAILPTPRNQVSFSLDLPQQAGGKISWPR